MQLVDPSTGVRLHGASTPDPGVVRLLQAAEWGTSGPRYQMHGVEHLVFSTPDVTWIHAWDGEALLGCYGLRRRTIRVGDQDVAAMYRMLLAVHPDHGGRGIGRALVTHTKAHFLDAADEPRILYGYIETDNARSMKLSEQVGYRSRGLFQSQFFTRRRPVARPDVGIAPPDSPVFSQILEAYQDHALFDGSDSVRRDDVWVLGGANPIAAVQVQHEALTLTSMPGWSGALLMGAIPIFTAAMPFFDGMTLRFLRLSHMWAAPGQESAFYDLISAVFAATGTFAGMAFVDPSCPHHQRIRAGGNPGLIDQLGVRPTAHVMAGSVGVDEADWPGGPLWISPNDPA